MTINEPLLFQPLRLRDLQLKNRVVISPMCQHAADAGRATPWHMVHLGKFALGGAGQMNMLGGLRWVAVATIISSLVKLM